MRETTRRLLIEAARLYPCVIISGRALDDLSERLAGVPVWYLFGNHGLEPPPPGIVSPTPATEWARELERRLPEDPGIVIEDKRYSLTIHYRNARDKRRAVEAIDRVVARLPDARALGGAEAVSLLPRGGGNKGVALQQACAGFHLACQDEIDSLLEILVDVRTAMTAGQRTRSALAGSFRTRQSVGSVGRVLSDPADCPEA